MPTDDDYGRRERLLLHQHPASQYGQASSTASPVPASSSSSSSSSSSAAATHQQQQQQQQQHGGVDNIVTGSSIGITGLPSGLIATDCYHKQQPQQQQQQQQQQPSNQRAASSSSSTASASNVGRGVSPITCHQDRYQINDRLPHPNEGHSEYGARMSLDRYEKSNDKHHQQQQQQQQQSHCVNNADDLANKYSDSSTACTMQSTGIDVGRYAIGSGQDSRFVHPASSGMQIAHHNYGIVTVASGRSSSMSNQTVTPALSQGVALNDRYSRYSEASSLSSDQRLTLPTNDRYQQIGNDSIDHNAYSHVRTSSSNDERTIPHSSIANVTKVTSEYANSSIITTSGLGLGSGVNVAGGCANGVFTPDTFPSPPSPAPASDRFVPPPPLSPSPSEKYASSQSLTAACYTNSSGDRGLPTGSPTTRDRYVTAPGSPMAMVKDNRYSAMSSDRVQSSSMHDTKEHQQPTRYGTSSTERLLASASPILGSMQSRDTDNGRCALFQVSGHGHKDGNSSGVSSRYSISSDRLMSSSPIHVPVPERFAAGNKNNDRYIGQDSPNHDTAGRYHHRQDVGSGSHADRYSTGICGATNERYLSSSPNLETNHGRYSSAERAGSTNGDHSGSRDSRRYSTSDRSLEGICQKYTERGERGCSGSPANAAEYSCRFSGFPEVTMQPRYPQDQRYSDIATIQRYSAQTSNQATSGGISGNSNVNRTNDRFSANNNNDRYISNSSPGHDSRLAGNTDGGRYNCGSSTERLLASSSSPSNSDNGSRYHGIYQTSSNSSQTKNDRYGSLSPTPENNVQSRNYSQQGSSTKNGNSNTNDKYIQVSKSMQLSYGTIERYHQVGTTQIDQFDRTNQDRGYTIDRYGNSTSTNAGDARYQISGANNGERFHSVNSDRYSPARSGSGDKYLSLPKPKDNYVTGRIATSCTSLGVGNSNVGGGNGSVSVDGRSYGATGSNSYVPPNAHTPVERYVPQPPPEVLYPDRYVDRYVPPAAHTPTDRYVPAADPGDPYMRRDLGFHHHYRLPPPGYPYHQSHFRFRSFAYASPGRLGGSPGSSSSSSSTSAQREFSTSPLLRPKARTSVIELANSARQVNANGQGNCCSDGSRNCCPTVRRSLPPGALPSIPNQSAHSSWQPSPSSGTTGTSTVSSSGTDGESTQSIGLYAVGVEVSKSEKSTATTLPTSSPPVASSCSGPQHNSNGPNITRSISAPAGPRPIVQPTFSTTSTSAATNQRHRLRRNMSRTEAIKNYIKRETATFFGVDEESESLEKQRWLDRRRRMASRKYGALLPEYKPPDPDITRDVPDSTEIPEGVTLRRWQQPVRRKDSVARMTLSGLHYMVETMTRQRPREKSEAGRESRSFPPSVISSLSQADGVSSSAEGAVTGEDDAEEETFFQRPPLPPPPPTTAPSVAEDTEAPAVEDGEVNFALSVRPETGIGGERDQSEELVRFTPHKEDRTVVDGQQVRRPRAITRDHYTSRTRSWRRSRQQDARVTCDPATGSQQEAGVILQRELSGGTRISPSTIDRVFDNSNRRQYGMGIVGRFFGRSFRKSVAHKPDVRKQLDDIEDHRPYFTYWITTVQVFILIISLACYGFGPFGIDLHRRSGLVLVTSLSLQQVDYDEPANFWLGPRAADLIHLGAKFGPCMRRDIKILNEIDVWRERERDTACCIRNDDSGCVQSSKADCSNTISTWKKWGPGDSGPGGRISGSVCGLDPKFCDAPASIAPYEWPDDITKWPICRKTNPFSQRFRSHNSHRLGNDDNFPIGRYKDKMAEHMVCEVIGHPCCIGIHGMCRITTKEYCDFVHGYFHEEASLCSQVECLHDVCGMMPFLHPEWPDQFYRLFTTTFLHAGIFHLAITLLVQYFLMRDLEKLTGSLRIALIYFTGGLAGNLASAIFIPHRAEVGPAGAHFALLATLVVEVLNCWPMLKHPRRALSKLIIILVGLLILGVLPWIDNYAHLFGFIFGFLAAYALMPFITFGHYDRRRKILLIWICLVLIIGLFAMLLAVFYNVPIYDCELCKLFNCIPFTRDFCASQNINFKKEEPV